VREALRNGIVARICLDVFSDFQRDHTDKLHQPSGNRQRIRCKIAKKIVPDLFN
jgi:hypothetical protein